MHVASQFSTLSPKRLYRPLDPTTQKSAAVTPRVKRPGPEPRFSRPFSTEFKNQWSYASMPQTFIHVLHRDHYIFYFTRTAVRQIQISLSCLLPKSCKNPTYAENITLECDILGYRRGDVEVFVLLGC